MNKKEIEFAWNRYKEWCRDHGLNHNNPDNFKHWKKLTGEWKVPESAPPCRTVPIFSTTEKSRQRQHH